MFLKYIFPAILCLVFSLLIRKFVEFEGEYEERKRPPRILVLITMALGFVPGFNYIIASVEIVLFLVILVSDGEGIWRLRKLKDTKINKWLFKS